MVKSKWDEEIERTAENLIENGNGYGVRVQDMIKIPAPFRKEVWRKVIELGNREDEES